MHLLTCLSVQGSWGRDEGVSGWVGGKRRRAGQKRGCNESSAPGGSAQAQWLLPQAGGGNMAEWAAASGLHNNSGARSSGSSSVSSGGHSLSFSAGQRRGQPLAPQGFSERWPHLRGGRAGPDGLGGGERGGSGSGGGGSGSGTAAGRALPLAGQRLAAQPPPGISLGITHRLRPGGRRSGPGWRAGGSGPGAAALVDAGAPRRRPGGGGRGRYNGTGGGSASALPFSPGGGQMASEKPGPGPGLEPQPVGLIAVGAGGGGGGGSGGGGSGGSAMGELRGASGSSSVVLPAGMINPSVPIRNIRMKFAVLIGLIQVGEVSNRDIVETVLNLVREKACSPSASQPPNPPPQPLAPTHLHPQGRTRCASLGAPIVGRVLPSGWPACAQP